MASSIDASTSGAGGVITTADNTGILQLKTAGTTAVTVDASQNVGIGTTSPNGKFESYANSGYSVIANSSAGSVAINPSSNAILFGTTNVAAYATGNYDAATHVYKTSGTERMRIDSSGNLLINTTGTTPTATNANVIYGGVDAGVMYMWRASGTTDQIRFYVNATKVGNITTTTTATTYNSGSDYRLKDNIVPMTNALDKVLQLKPVTFTWKADNSDGQGFIAHELQDIIPSAVTGKKDAIDAEGNPEYQGVDPSKIVATLTAAIQEQQTIINDLKARVTALEAK